MQTQFDTEAQLIQEVSNNPGVIRTYLEGMVPSLLSFLAGKSVKFRRRRADSFAKAVCCRRLYCRWSDRTGRNSIGDYDFLYEIVDNRQPYNHDSKRNIVKFKYYECQPYGKT